MGSPGDGCRKTVTQGGAAGSGMGTSAGAAGETSSSAAAKGDRAVTGAGSDRGVRSTGATQQAHPPSAIVSCTQSHGQSRGAELPHGGCKAARSSPAAIIHLATIVSVLQRASEFSGHPRRKSRAILGLSAAWIGTCLPEGCALVARAVSPPLPSSPPESLLKKFFRTRFFSKCL